MHFLITNNYNLRFSKYLSGMIQRKFSVLKAECWVCSTYVGRRREDQGLLGQKRPVSKEHLFLRLLRHSLAGQTRLASALRESSCRCLQGAGITDNYQDVQHHRWDQTYKNCWGEEMTHSNCGKQVDSQKSKQLCDLAIPLLVHGNYCPLTK